MRSYDLKDPRVLNGTILAGYEHFSQLLSYEACLLSMDVYMLASQPGHAIDLRMSGDALYSTAAGRGFRNHAV